MKNKLSIFIFLLAIGCSKTTTKGVTEEKPGINICSEIIEAKKAIDSTREDFLQKYASNPKEGNFDELKFSRDYFERSNIDKKLLTKMKELERDVKKVYKDVKLNSDYQSYDEESWIKMFRDEPPLSVLAMFTRLSRELEELQEQICNRK